jgi:hypothetical protein
MARRSGRSPASPGTLAADSAGASASVVAFMVAGVLFMASVVAVLVATNDTGGEGSADATDTAAMRVRARDLASTVLTSPGYAAGGGDWADGAHPLTGATASAEDLRRLGLLDHGAAEPNMLDYSKFQNLRRAKYSANATNGYVDYQEARSSLGLDAAGLDFHVRAYPALQSVVDLLGSGQRDKNLRIAYVGDIEVEEITTSNQPATLTDGLNWTTPTCRVDNAAHPRMFRISTTVTNGGDTATQFTAVTAADLGVSLQTQNTNGYLVQPGGSVTLYADVAYLEGRSCGAGSSITFDLYDPVHARLVPIQHNFTAADGSATGFPSSTTTRGLYIDTGDQYYLTSQRVVLNYGGTNLGNNDRLFLRVCKGTAECTSAPDLVYMKESNGRTFSAGNAQNGRNVDIGTLPAGEYTAWLYDCQTPGVAPCATHNNDPAVVRAGHVRATERILVTEAPVGGYHPQGEQIQETRYTASGHGAIEVAYLEALVERFCPSFFDSKERSPLGGWASGDWDTRCAAFKDGQDQPGDVFPDTKKAMNNDLPARLLNADGTPNYERTNVLVVGSNVDQNAMTSQSAKGTIRDWVVGGGTLIVFGSGDGNVNWLEPLFHSAIRSGSGPISTPDISHPILHTPDVLDDPAHNYDARGHAWRFNGQTAQIQANQATALFTNVIVEGNQQTGNPLLADSKPGAIGNGSIILTSYFPYDVYGSGPVGPAKGLQSQGPNACPGYTMGSCEALKFVHNLLMAGYADLYLDYGPECPQETNCIPDVRTAQIRHPLFTDPIQLRLNVFVFPA